MTSKAVVLVGGSSRGTRFRPLTLDHAKILFPIAGKPLLSHTIDAILKIDTITEIILIGFYEQTVFTEFVSHFNSNMKFEGRNCSMKYLKEFKALGTAGGLYHFKEEILKDNTANNFLIVHGDIICSFPIQKMIDKYESKKLQNGKAPDAILFGVNMDRATYDLMIALNINSKTEFGVILEDDVQDRVVHYVEKPESNLSTIINGGIYLFNTSIFKLLSDAKIKKIKNSNDETYPEAIDEDIISMERDVLQKLPDLNNTFVYNHKGFWKALKSPSDALWANELCLDLIYQSKEETSARFKSDNLAKLQKSSVNIYSPVYIHPSAKIDYSHGTKIGPYVSIGPNCSIGSGTRLSNSVILSDNTIGANSLVKNSIITDGCEIGQWCRIEGTGMNLVTVTELIRKNGTSKIKHIIETNEAFKVIGIKDSGNVSLLGSCTNVGDEVLILNSFILPNKSIRSDLQYEIVM